MHFAVTRRPEPLVDVTPLIDIIFQLVIFFMVSTNFVTTPGIEVDLPRSSADTILRDRSEVKVWVTSEGSIYLDDNPVTWDQLSSALRGRADSEASTLVIIKADKEVDHGRVVGVMDLARRYGLSRLAIATEGRGGSTSGQKNTED